MVIRVKCEQRKQFFVGTGVAAPVLKLYIILRLGLLYDLEYTSLKLLIEF